MGTSDTSRQADPFYVSVLQRIIDVFTDILGSKVARMHARRAPLRLTPDGMVKGYYGNGKNAIQILITEYHTVLGERFVADQIQARVLDNMATDERDRLPAGIGTQ